MIVYLATNLIDGKMYVGKTIRPLKDRWKSHKCGALTRNSQTYFHRAIRKHGINFFKVEVLASASGAYAAEVLAGVERSAIATLGTKAPNGYNESDGGEGNLNPSPESRYKMGSAQRGKGHLRSADTRRKMGTPGNHFSKYQTVSPEGRLGRSFGAHNRWHASGKFPPSPNCKYCDFPPL